MAAGKVGVGALDDPRADVGIGPYGRERIQTFRKKASR